MAVQLLTGIMRSCPMAKDINEGEWFEIWWGGDCRNGYPGRQDILALPDPSNDNGYYLITKPSTHNDSGSSYKHILQYSYVDMSLDNGMGDVTVKNEIVHHQDSIQASYLTAYKHANNTDWWIIQPTRDSNSYIKLLLDESGLKFHSKQFIGENFHWNASAAGIAKFSPDGSKYAYYNPFNFLMLYDFDRQTGELSNYQQVFIDAIETFSAIEFSASGRFLYFALSSKMYQFDLHHIGSEEAIIFIEEWDELFDPFATNFFL